LDVTSRAVYDAKIQARLLRKKRDREATESIRQLKSDLRAREAEALLASRPKPDNLKKLRDETAIFRAERADRAAKKAETERKNEALKATLPASFHITTVILKWDSKTKKYTESDLMSIVRPYGSVEATLMMKAGGQATIVLSSEKSAISLVTSLSPSSDLGIQHGFTHVYMKQSTAPTPSTTAMEACAETSETSQAPEASSSHRPSTASSVASTLDDDAFEQMVLSRMKGVKKGKMS
jgi:hypothetical protein